MDERMGQALDAAARKDGLFECKGVLLSYAATRKAVEAAIITSRELGDVACVDNVMLTHVFEELDLDAFEATLREKLVCDSVKRGGS